MKLAFLITTYNRPTSCLRLVQQLLPHGHVVVVDDCSSEDYSIVKGCGCHYIRLTHHNGKRKYWQTVTEGLMYLRPYQFNYWFMLPDDMLPLWSSPFDAVAEFQQIKDERKIMLSVYTDVKRYMKPSWGQYRTVDMGAVWLSGWCDLAFVAPKSLLNILQFRIPPIQEPQEPTLSSGVGRYITLQLRAKSLNMYHVTYSLMECQKEAYKSAMNPVERENNPLINKAYVMKKLDTSVTIGIASIPWRREMLKKTIESLLPQVDKLVVGLNIYPDVPDFCNHPKIEVHRLDNSTGDSAKFYTVQECTGYYGTADDDVIYPADYVAKMVEAMQKNGNNVLLTGHGRIMKPRPLKSYYKGHLRMFHLFRDLDAQQRCDIGSCCALFFHTDTLKVHYSDFALPNMTDIWISKAAHEQGVPIICIPHKGNWCVYQIKDKQGQIVEDTRSIHYNSRNNDAAQTALVNQFLK